MIASCSKDKTESLFTVKLPSIKTTNIATVCYRHFKVVSVIATKKISSVLARSSLSLLENDSINRNTNTNAEGREHSKRHLQPLMFHPVQVVHVLGVKVVWFIMPMSPHPLHSS